MIAEPLPSLLAAVEHELAVQREEYAARYGMELDFEAVIDEQERAVMITGECLMLWGPRTMLEARIGRAGLRSQTHAPNMQITVYPALESGQSQNQT